MFFVILSYQHLDLESNVFQLDKSLKMGNLHFLQFPKPGDKRGFWELTCYRSKITLDTKMNETTMPEFIGNVSQQRHQGSLSSLIAFT